MKGDSVRRQTVNLALSHRDPVENRDRSLLYPIRECIFGDHAADLTEGPRVQVGVIFNQ